VTYYQQQTIVADLNGRVKPGPRPGVETLIFGGTASELERKCRNPSIETGEEQDERHDYNAHELVITPVHDPQRTTGKQKKLTASSVDLSAGKQGPHLPQFQRANSFQGSPSNSPQPYYLDIDNPAATTEEPSPLPPTSNIHSEPSDRSVPRANTLSSRTSRAALGFDSTHHWALERKVRYLNPAVISPMPDHDSSQDAIPLDDMSWIPSTSNLEPPLRIDNLRTTSDPNLQVERQVESEHDVSEISSMPQPSGYEDSNENQPASQHGGVMTTRLGVWR